MYSRQSAKVAYSLYLQRKKKQLGKIGTEQ